MVTMSVLGLYSWDNTLFDGMSLPTDIESDRETLINNLLLECSELEVLYPDFEYLKFAITTWSKKQVPIWTKLYETTTYEYDPISNYDRKEEWADESIGETSGERTPDLRRSMSPVETTTMSKKGYNADNFIQQEQVEKKGSDTIREQGSESSNSNTSINSSHSGRVHGNIGVTTTQAMIEQERNVAKYNLIDVIIEEFKLRFCLLVY